MSIEKTLHHRTDSVPNTLVINEAGSVASSETENNVYTNDEKANKQVTDQEHRMYNLDTFILSLKM